MKQLNIAIVVGYFPTVSETFIVNQITALINRGHTVTIYAYKRGKTQKIHDNILRYHLLDRVVYKEKPQKELLKRVFTFLKLIYRHLFKLHWSLLFKSLNFFKYGKKALTLKVFYNHQFFILNKKFDIVHVHFGTNAVEIADSKSEGFLGKARFVISFHGFDINPSKIEFYKVEYKDLFKHAHQITVNTPYTESLLRQVNPMLSNLHILPVGLDTEKFKKENKSDKKDGIFKIVFCGRLVSFKGVMLLPVMANELKKRGRNNFKLVVIGEGELKKQLANKICELNLQDLFSLLGALKQEAIIREFETAQLFLLPGIYDEPDGRAENQGLVIQEAQAMEIPVIVSDVGGMKYGMIPNKTGYVVKEKDITAFADTIEYLIKYPEKAKDMGREGRKFVIENYDSGKLVDTLVSIYLS